MYSAGDSQEYDSSSYVKGFLGRGWKYPITVNGGSKIDVSPYEQSIRESILIILGTRKGERVMRPDFGCGIHELVFENINSTTLGHMELSIHEALTKFEPRIKLLKVEILDDQVRNGMLPIKIYYEAITTNNRFNMVFPFYINES